MATVEPTRACSAPLAADDGPLPTVAAAGPSLLLRETFRRACEYVACHYGDPALDACAIARQLRCSRATLYRAFQAYEATVADHIQRVRFQHVQASFALSPPRVPISSIAMDCGFTCLRHFNRRFKQVFGDTPGAYRMALRQAAVMNSCRDGRVFEQAGLPPFAIASGAIAHREIR